MRHYCLACSLLLFWLPPAGAGEQFVFFGTYTGAKSQGVYVSRFDPATGRLTPPELAADIRNPSFLALHPNERYLYTVGEAAEAQDKGNGSVSAFAIDAQTGKLTLINRHSSGGGEPCHLAVDAKGKCVLAANYGSGSVAVLPIHADGSLGAPATTIQHTGSSVNPQRQAGPHAHFICPAPDNRFALACDLGLDRVIAYQLDLNGPTLNPAKPEFATVAPGAGPRHLTFSPDGKFVYVINEMISSIVVFRYDAKSAALTEVQTISTLPKDAATTSYCAEIAMHLTGQFLYGSNRGHDSIAVFAVDRKSGRLTSLEYTTTQGKTPRHFAIDPTGRWLLAENQGSDSVVLFSIDAVTGKLKPAGQTVTVGSPVCAVFLGGRP
ncbi:MAG: lactonase family protein [Verrucomicrobia subdivision 3 bacterium]|nr:lactonase family protein [Limisphaerales bacterium]